MISIVMPAYNEAAMLEASVREVVNGLRGTGEPFAVHIVENGSTDGTPAIAARLAEQIPEVVTHSMRAANYGEALRTGLLESTGTIGVIFDVDYYDLHFLKQALELLDARESPTGPAIVVGSKRAPGARDERSRLRRAATSVFSTILRHGFGLHVSDTHGMKVLNLSALRDAVRACRSGADLFDTELIIRAEHSGLVTAEIPVTVAELRPSRTPIARRVPRTLVGLARLRMRLGGARRG
jgi:glycosyltransferase involved in cell wall biosynthesis